MHNLLTSPNMKLEMTAYVMNDRISNGRIMEHEPLFMFVITYYLDWFALALLQFS